MVTPTTNAESFTWAKNGTVITGATQGSLQLTSAGTYAVTVSSAKMCSKYNFCSDRKKFASR